MNFNLLHHVMLSKAQSQHLVPISLIFSTHPPTRLKFSDQLLALFMSSR